jgi:hypothetical protein
MAKVAGTRWTVEEGFQQAKELTGLDERQVRRWNSWRRWVTLAPAASAVLAVAAALAGRTPPPEGLIPLTVSEVRRLLVLLLFPPIVDTTHRLARSQRRRRRQARARACHYRRQRSHTP